MEALPAGEVREELAALGVDPARSIAFAKSLARGGDSPGGRLMGALLAGEEEDDEIARIESADIEEVRAQGPSRRGRRHRRRGPPQGRHRRQCGRAGCESAASAAG